MSVIKALLDGIFAARVASALLDIGIDVNKLHPMLSDVLMTFEREHRGKNSPRESATIFLLTYMSVLPSSTFIFSQYLPELIERAEVIMDMWVSKGRMNADFANQHSTLLRKKLREHMEVVSTMMNESWVDNKGL